MTTRPDSGLRVHDPSTRGEHISHGSIRLIRIALHRNRHSRPILSLFAHIASCRSVRPSVRPTDRRSVRHFKRVCCNEYVCLCVCPQRDNLALQKHTSTTHKKCLSAVANQCAMHVAHARMQLASRHFHARTSPLTAYKHTYTYDIEFTIHREPVRLLRGQGDMYGNDHMTTSIHRYTIYLRALKNARINMGSGTYEN